VTTPIYQCLPQVGTFHPRCARQPCGEVVFFDGLCSFHGLERYYRDAGVTTTASGRADATPKAALTADTDASPAGVSSNLVADNGPQGGRGGYGGRSGKRQPW
jgi:hypothetical protein